MYWMAVLFVISGMAWLVSRLVVRTIRRDPSRRVSIALLIMLGYGLLSIVAGMSRWRHYLLELVPVLAMSAALASTPYRYSWSLPLRLMDPHLAALVTLLNGPRAPTWLVRITSLNMYGLDKPQFEKSRSAHYRLVATVCHHAVYLHRGVIRSIPPNPDCKPFTCTVIR
jgi:hypothetical protein